MEYEVIISDLAQTQLEEHLHYIVYELKNEQAAQSVLADFNKTRDTLERVAGSLKESENDRLRELGYKVIHLEKHRYVMVYRVVGSVAMVQGVYHELQDYANLLR
jgi:ribosomal protein S6